MAGLSAGLLEVTGSSGGRKPVFISLQDHQQHITPSGVIFFARLFLDFYEKIWVCSLRKEIVMRVLLPARRQKRMILSNVSSLPFIMFHFIISSKSSSKVFLLMLHPL